MNLIDTFKANAVAVWDAIEPTVLSDLLTLAELALTGMLGAGVAVVTNQHVGDLITSILGHAENQLKLDVVNLEPVLLNSVVSTFVATKSSTAAPAAAS